MTGRLTKRELVKALIDLPDEGEVTFVDDNEEVVGFTKINEESS